MNLPVQQTTDKKQKRVFLVTIAFLSILFVVFIWRAFELVYDSPVPKEWLSKKPTVRRGTIFDSQLHELAISLDTVSIALRPNEMVNKEQSIFLISKVLKMDPAEIYKKLETGSDFVWIKRKVNVEYLEDLRRLKIPSLVFQREPSRFYPNKKMASTVLGFTGLDNQGMEGVEYQFNSILMHDEDGDSAGNNIHLTINAYVQRQLEIALADGIKKTGAKSGIGIITETHTGKILAMTSLPDYDPNEATKYPRENWVNRAIGHNIEPGSTFKIFVLAALFKEHMVDEKKTYYCPGYFEYKKVKVKCSAVHKNLTIDQIIKKSCNSGIIQTSWQMQVIRLYENLKYFGFGNSTHINLPGEGRGFLPVPEKWDPYRKANIPIGQGLSVTPLQLIIAGNSIANGGALMKPMIIQKVTSANGDLIEMFEPEEKFTTVTNEVSKKIMSYLLEVVTQGGTGSEANVPGYSVAGKTSTAMVSDSTHYIKGKYQASFLGFFPGDKPRISVYIMLDEPAIGAHHGGQAAAPVFREVISRIIPVILHGKVQRVEVIPETDLGTPKFNPAIMPDFRKKSKKEVLYQVWEYFPGDHSVYGSGYLLQQTPAAGEKIKPPYNFTLYFKEE
ncbi:MAG: penicillin-binding transpeptidase domain-containing protein [Leptospirales bacterium]